MRFPDVRFSRGFSMLELLVATGLLALLALLAVPAVQRSVEASRTTQCLANLRQLGVEVLGTMSEHNGGLAWYEGKKGIPGMWWHAVHSRSNFEDFTRKMSCPSYEQTYLYNYRSTIAPMRGSYRYNKYLGYQHHVNGNWIYPLVKMQTVRQPHRLALVADTRYPLADRADDSTGFEEWKGLYKAHQGGTKAVVFCMDGHAEIVTEANSSQIVQPPQYLK